jgi:hypothetical protein
MMMVDDDADDDSRLDRYAVREVGNIRILVHVVDAFDLGISLRLSLLLCGFLLCAWRGMGIDVSRCSGQ